MWILLIVGVALAFIGVAAYIFTIFSLVTSIPTNPDTTTPVTPDFSGFVVGISITVLFALAGSVVELIGRIGMLIRQAKQQQWAWFVCTLLLGWICMLIYLIVWPETPPPVMLAPVYAPQYQPMTAYPYQVPQQPPYYGVPPQQGIEQAPPQE